LADQLVVDASVAVKWYLLEEDDADRAESLLDAFDRGGVELIAPYHIRYEVASVVTSASLGRQPRLSREQATLAVAEFLSLGITTIVDLDLIPDAFALVHLHGCAFYDALYLALAQRLELPFVTADRKLLRRIDHLPGVLPLSDFPTPNA
jgi:predicted nucleic acid-binding protein